TADVNWTHFDQKFSGVITAPTNIVVAKPAAVYQLKNQDQVNLILRAQRNF
ncbi:MAG TPA: porin, partial [Bradyrhizobium sp.]